MRVRVKNLYYTNAPSEPPDLSEWLGDAPTPKRPQPVPVKPPSDYYTVQETATALLCSRRTVHRYIRAGLLVASQPGKGKVLITRASVTVLAARPMSRR